MRTSLLIALFTAGVTFPLTAAPVDPHQQARRLMAEAQQTSNPVRLFMLALDIRESLEAALKKRPKDVEVLLDLVRFHTVTPRVAGGSSKSARTYAKQLARLDAGLGHFAKGYLAYREKQFGVARRELNEAVNRTTGSHRTMSLQWLGWLSQESQQYTEAFAIWEQLRGSDPKALYEIARTSTFCHCEKERGKAALAEYLKVRPDDSDARALEEKLK